MPRFKPEAENGTEHYKILVQALAATQKVISTLDISPKFGHGLPAFVFDMSSDLGRGLSQLAKIGPGLEYLSLRLPWIDPEFSTVSHLKVGGTPSCSRITLYVYP